MGDLHFDPYSRQQTDDPYPLYKRLRDEAPLFHDCEHDVWVISRYVDVQAALRDHAGLISSEGSSIDGSDKGFPYLVLKDPPEHSWYKAVVTRLFTPGKMAKLEAMVREKAVELLGECRERGSFDLVEDFAVRLPLDIISELIDIPAEYRAEIHHWTAIGLLRGEDFDRARYEESHRRRQEIYLGLIAERRRVPRDDAISSLIHLEVQDEHGSPHHLDDRTLAFHFLELALAGHETVSRAIPNGALALHTFPDEWTRLMDDPTLLPGAVEEFLRYDSPVQMLGRVATRDIALSCGTVPAGGRAMVLQGAGLRDERAFPEPDRLIVDRPPDPRSIYFGNGIHKCLGIHLARLEIRIAFEELLRMLPDFAVDPSGVTRRVAVGVRGPSRLPTMAGVPALQPHH